MKRLHPKFTKELASAVLKELRPVDVSLAIKVLCGSPLMARPSIDVLLQTESRLFWLAALTSFAQSQSHSGLYLGGDARVVDCFDSLGEDFYDSSLTLVDLLGTGAELCVGFLGEVVESGQLSQHPSACFVYRSAGDLIYLQRWYRMEATLGDFVRERLQREAFVLPNALKATFQRFFSTEHLADNPWQAAACLAALLHDFSVITGGPGTGKTTTVTRMVGLLLSLPEEARPTSIAMVAPTGKAAERMREAFSENFSAMVDQLPDSEAGAKLAERKQAIMQSASTVHAFLGSMGSSGFRHNAGNPVSCDVLIIDESSMVDLELFIALFAALPSHCRIVLLGDKNQLAAVGTGNVFTDLTGTQASSFGNLNVSSADFQAVFETMSACALPHYTNAAPALCGDQVVELVKSYRFSGDSEVGQLARLLLNEGRLPKQGELPVDCITLDADWKGTLTASAVDYKAALLRGADAAELLDVMGDIRVLCAVRRGEHGVEAINRLLAEFVLGGVVNPTQPQDGLPFMIRSNDKNLGLANGDCGVFRADESGELVAYLPAQIAGGRLRALTPFVLPDWEAAFALTIHKSQGSEYKSVVVVLPEIKRQFISWELVYTAITRGKQKVSLVLPQSLLGQSVPRVQRRSGLRQELLVN